MRLRPPFEKRVGEPATVIGAAVSGCGSSATPAELDDDGPLGGDSLRVQLPRFVGPRTSAFRVVTPDARFSLATLEERPDGLVRFCPLDTGDQVLFQRHVIRALLQGAVKG